MLYYSCKWGISDEKILITGGDGFIGSHELVDLLANASKKGTNLSVSLRTATSPARRGMREGWALPI